MVRVQGVHLIGPLVHRDELLRAFLDVHVLRPASDGLLPAKIHHDADHVAANRPNGDRLPGQLLVVYVPKIGAIVPHLHFKYSTFHLHVFQLLRALRKIFLQIVPESGRQKEALEYPGQHLHQQ